MPHPLDNPTWSALTSLQADFAQVEREARRFPADVCIHGALADFSPSAWEALARIGREPLSLFSLQPLQLPFGWTVVRAVELYEMVLQDGDWLRDIARGPGTADGQIEELTAADLSQMSSLYAATRPGRSLSPRQYLLGGFVGVKRHGQVVAMGCLRLHLPGYREISTVATLPGYTGQGYGTTVVAELARRILDRGETPFLTVRTDNHRAIEIYRRLGFRERIRLHSTTLRFDGPK